MAANTNTNTNTQNPVPENTVFSICIPWVEKDTTEIDIRYQFQSEFEWGTINKVDFIESKHGTRPHFKVFIHFSSFNNDDVKQHLMEGKELKAWYSDRFFWKVRKSNFVYKPPQQSQKKNTWELA